MVETKSRYLGIDLGTTNSCVAWGQYNARIRQVLPEVIPIRMTGIPIAQQLIPSVVTYNRGQRYPKGIGLAARQQLLSSVTDTDSVTIRSVKLQMGKERVAEAPWLAPEQISADILNVLKDGAERLFGELQTNAVVGVPACFNTDQWEATKRAAEMAGFTSAELIDEPKAILLDFIQSQDQLLVEDQVLDFRRPKTICVFDPGGGTVDVSVVQVQQTSVTKGGKAVYEMRYDDLGLTRYLVLGGDHFDQLLVDFLQDKFAIQTGIRIEDIGNPIYRSLAQTKLLEYAEDAKKNLSDQVMDLVRLQKISEEQAIEKAFADILILNLYESYSFNYHLTYREYSRVIAPLLGWSFELQDIEHSDIQQELASPDVSQKSNNIIFPICDAILKAKKTLGLDTIPQIDAVLISGGMSKLQVLRHRLRKFFGPHTPIVEVLSPDLSVARGAVVHHYNLVHGLDRTSNLLPEAISLEVAAKTFVQLVPANTQYPTTTPIVPKGFQLIIPGSGIPHLDIPLWRGEPMRPTAKLFDRRIDLRDKADLLHAGDEVDIQVTIDANRQLKLEAWLRRNPRIRFGVTTLMP